jgi:hypothetical protein
VNERAVLMNLIEAAETVEPDWQDALRRAGFVARYRPRDRRRPTTRRVLVLAVVLLGMLYGVAAIAADEPGWSIRYWIFDRSQETYPTTQLATVGEWHEAPRMGLEHRYTKDGVEVLAATIPVLLGEVAGRGFEMQVYLRPRGDADRVQRSWRPGASDLCVGFEPGGTPKPYHGTDIPSFAGGTCNPPIQELRPFGYEELHRVGATLHVPGPIEPTGGGTGPKYLFGVAAPNVRRVDLESRDGTVVRVPTFAGPPDLGVPVRLWVAALRLDHLVHTIVPRDDEGDALEHWHLPWAY